MATIASVNINVAANVGKFQAGMKAAEVRLKTFSSQTVPTSAKTQKFIQSMNEAGKSAKKLETNVGSLSSRMKGLFGTLAAAVGTRQTLAFFSNLNDELDAIGKTADRMRVMPNTLLAIRREANKSGIEFEAFTTSLDKMRLRISEAAAGTGEAVNAFRELGLDAAALRKQGLVEQFESVAAALRGVDNASDQTRLAMKLFEEQGAKLLTLINNQPGAIAASEKRFRQLGIDVTDSAQAAAIANDAWSDMMDSIRLGTAGTAFSELKTAFADIFSEIFSGTDAVTRTFNRAQVAAEAVAAAGKAKIDALEKSTRKLVDTTSDLGKVAARDSFFGNSAAGTDAKSAVELAVELDNHAREFAESLAKQNAALRLSRDGLENYELKLGSVNRFIREEIDALRAERMELEASAKAREDDVAKLDEMRSKAEQLKDSLRSPFGVFRDDIAEINELFKNGLIDIEQWQKAAEKLGDQLINDVPSRIAGVAPGSPAALEAGTAGAFTAINQRGQQEQRLLRATESIDRRAAVAEQLSRERNRLLREGRVAAAEIPG